MAIELLEPIKRINSKNCYNEVGKGIRKGVMLHFDDSDNDTSAVEWFTDPTCKVSYNRLYLDSGKVVEITPDIERPAWHAGYCIDTDANHHYYGLSASTNTKVPVTPAQFEALCHDAAALFVKNSWGASQVDTRIVGHEDQAIFNQHDNPGLSAKWGKLGRKIDPTGLHAGNPILSTMAVRRRVVALLSAA